MKVVILCGGLGTRLREETEFKPKPMVNIGTKPILWHIMKYYSSFGYKDFILCLGYRGEIIKDYFYNYEMMNSDFTIKFGKTKSMEFLQSNYENDWTVTLVSTGEKNLKGSRLKQIQKYIDTDNFMVTYGDGLSDVDITKLVSFHKNHGKVVTLTGVNPISRFGELKINENQIEDFREKPNNVTNFVNGGYFVFNKKIFDYLSDDENCDLETEPFDILSKEKQMMVFKHLGNWSCMDTLRDTEYINKLWNEDEAFWKNW